MLVASLPGNVERDLLFHYAACTAGKVVDVGRVCEQLRSPAKCHGPICIVNSAVKVFPESLSMRFPVDSPHDRG